ncbi:MAG: hypothetical protein ACRCX2_22725 [Paraclostridium sp.]
MDCDINPHQENRYKGKCCANCRFIRLKIFRATCYHEDHIFDIKHEEVERKICNDFKKKNKENLKAKCNFRDI